MQEQLQRISSAFEEEVKRREKAERSEDSVLQSWKSHCIQNERLKKNYDDAKEKLEQMQAELTNMKLSLAQQSKGRKVFEFFPDALNLSDAKLQEFDAAGRESRASQLSSRLIADVKTCIEEIREVLESSAHWNQVRSKRIFLRLIKVALTREIDGRETCRPGRYIEYWETS